MVVIEKIVKFFKTSQRKTPKIHENSLKSNKIPFNLKNLIKSGKTYSISVKAQ